MSWLDDLLSGVKTVFSGGNVLPQQPALAFEGTGVSVSNNPTTHQTVVTITGGSGSGQQNVTLSNGLNSNVDTAGNAVVRVGGPSAPFSIDGFTVGGTPGAGQRFVLVNTVAFPLTVVNQGSGSSVGNRIDTLRQRNIVLPTAGSSCAFVWDATAAEWVLEHDGVILDVYGDGPAGRFVFSRSAPIPLPASVLAHVGNLSPSAPGPYLLSTAFASLGAAQTAFPLSTTAGDLTSGTYGTNSLDWAVINEAIRQAEASTSATVWLDHGAYGVIGTFTVHAGIVIKGQGSQGANSGLSTAIVHFSTADLFYWKGDADPFSTGGFAGTGGGLENVTIWKANREAFGGSYYVGGRALYVEAQSPAKRPGEMFFKNVLIATEGGTHNSLWSIGWEINGKACTSNGVAGVRDMHGTKIRVAGCSTAGKSVYFHYAEHVCITGLQINQGNGSAPGLTIEGDSNELQFPGLMMADGGSVTIQDTTPVNVTGATNANPTIVHAVGHGFPIGDTPNVFITGVGGNTGVNGGWTANAVADADHLSIPVDTSGGSAYTSGGTVRSQSPTDVNLHGEINGLSVTALHATGSFYGSLGLSPFFAPVQTLQNSKSSHFDVRGAYAPAVQFEVFNHTYANITGDGTLATLQFNALNYDTNGDQIGTSPPYGGYTAFVAGRYRFHARILMQGLDVAPNTGIHVNTYATLALVFTRAAGNVSYTTQQSIPVTTNGFETIEIDESVYMNDGDSVIVQLEVFGGSTAGVGVYGDTGSGFSTFSAELL